VRARLTRDVHLLTHLVAPFFFFLNERRRGGDGASSPGDRCQPATPVLLLFGPDRHSIVTRSSLDRHSIVARSSLDRRRRADRRGTRDPSGVIQSSFVMIWLLHVKMVNEDYLKAVDSLLLVEYFKKWLKCGKMFWQRFGYWWTLLHYWSGTNFACCNRDFFSIEKIKCHDSSFRWIARASGTMALVDGPDFTRKVYCPFVLFLFLFFCFIFAGGQGPSLFAHTIDVPRQLYGSAWRVLRWRPCLCVCVC